MKYVPVIPDGMADRPLQALSGQTLLGFFCLPHFTLVAYEEKGYALTTPKGPARRKRWAISGCL